MVLAVIGPDDFSIAQAMPVLTLDAFGRQCVSVCLRKEEAPHGQEVAQAVGVQCPSMFLDLQESVSSGRSIDLWDHETSSPL